VVRASSDIVTLKATKYRNIIKRYSLSAFYQFDENKQRFKQRTFENIDAKIKQQDT
jgi:hypothetical protein